MLRDFKFKLTRLIDQGNATDVYLVCIKTFDKINYNFLLDELERHGFIIG